MLNHTCTVGRLTRDPKLAYTKSKNAVATFTLAVDRPGTYGEKKKTDFIDYVIWRKPAESFTKLCQKGTLVSVSGKTTTRTYKDTQTNKTVKVTEIVVDDFDILKGMKPKDKVLSSENDSEDQDLYLYLTDEDVPF